MLLRLVALLSFLWAGLSEMCLRFTVLILLNSLFSASLRYLIPFFIISITQNLTVCFVAMISRFMTKKRKRKNRRENADILAKEIPGKEIRYNSELIWR